MWIWCDLWLAFSRGFTVLIYICMTMMIARAWNDWVVVVEEHLEGDFFWGFAFFFWPNNFSSSLSSLLSRFFCCLKKIRELFFTTTQHHSKYKFGSSLCFFFVGASLAKQRHNQLLSHIILSFYHSRVAHTPTHTHSGQTHSCVFEPENAAFLTRKRLQLYQSCLKSCWNSTWNSTVAQNHEKWRVLKCFFFLDHFYHKLGSRVSRVSRVKLSCAFFFHQKAATWNQELSKMTREEERKW